MNWENKTLFVGDNLHVMRGMNAGTVDLIYLDPPFNSNRTYAAPIGSRAAGAAFKDAWNLSDIDLIEHQALKQDHPALYTVIDAAGSAHSKGMKSYLIMMAVRLLEMRRLLKDTGSLYLHCDPTASHYLKLVLDAILGVGNFRNEIVWHYRRWTGKAKCFQRLHDTMFYYTKAAKYSFNVLYTPYTEKSFDRKQNYHTRTKEGDVFETSIDERGVRENDVWQIPILNSQSKERVGYPTQKPIALLDRILRASSNEDDVILDPFCGCATTLVVADRLGRQWVGIDLSAKAGELVRDRIEADQGHLFKDIQVRDDIPQRTDLEPPLTAAEKREYKKTLYGLQMGYCNGCNEHFQLRNLHMDHITARARGGTDHAWNFQLLCGACNSTKGKKTQAEFQAEMAQGRNLSWLDAAG